MPSDRPQSAQGRGDDRRDHPGRNAKDFAELPAVVREGMELIQVDSLDEVLAAALLPAAAGAEEAARSLQVA